MIRDQIQWLEANDGEQKEGDWPEQQIRNIDYLKSHLPGGGRRPAARGRRGRRGGQHLGLGQQLGPRMNLGEFHDAMLRQQQMQQPVQPPPPVILQGQSAVVPVPVPVGAATGKQIPTIVIKQTVKQIQATRGRVRDKKVRFNNKGVIAKLKKQYAAAKKQLYKELTTKRKLEYEKHNKRIKQLPSKERKNARKKIRAGLAKKMKQLKSALLPVSRLKKSGEVEQAIKSLKKVKW
jgi:hypothetical protein